MHEDATGHAGQTPESARPDLEDGAQEDPPGELRAAVHVAHFEGEIGGASVRSVVGASARRRLAGALDAVPERARTAPEVPGRGACQVRDPVRAAEREPVGGDHTKLVKQRHA